MVSYILNELNVMFYFVGELKKKLFPSFDSRALWKVYFWIGLAIEKIALKSKISFHYAARFIRCEIRFLLAVLLVLYLLAAYLTLRI